MDAAARLVQVQLPALAMVKLAAIALAFVAALAITMMTEPVVLYGKVTHVYIPQEPHPAIYR